LESIAGGSERPGFQERRHVEIPNENTGERYGVSRNSAVFVAECRAAAPRHQPFDRFTIQLGNPEQDRGAGFLEPAFDGQKLAVSNADRDLSVAGAEDAVLGDGGGYAFGRGYVECGVADGAANGNITGIRLILQPQLPWSRGADRRHPGSSAGAQDRSSLRFGSTSPFGIAGADAGTAALTISATAATSTAQVCPLRNGGRWYNAGAVLACILFFGMRTYSYPLLMMNTVLSSMRSGSSICCR
jgi:hypothetical protein